MKTTFPKKRLLILFLILIVLTIGIIFQIITPSPSKTLPSPAQPSPTIISNQINYQSLAPGQSTLDQVTKQLGTPLSSTTSAQGTHYTFNSGNQYLPNEVIINRQNQVEFINHHLTEKPSENQIEKYSQKFARQPIKLYSQTSLSGVHLYVFPQNGLAVEATEKGGLGLSLKYFSPTDINTFIEKYAPRYSQTFDPDKFHD